MSSSSSVPQFNPSKSPNYGFIVPTAPSPNMRAMLVYVDAVQRQNLKDIMACFDEFLEHRILPQSLGRPVLNRRQYAEYLRGIMPLVKRHQLTIHQVIEAGDKMTVHASSFGESVTDVPYNHELILILSFVPPPADSDELPKMRFVKEFVDSVHNSKFFIEERAKAKIRESEARQKLRS